jgi:hypothetical protein
MTKMTTSPEFEETVDKAAQAIYAKTSTGQNVQWDLLPRNVQNEIRNVARTAITVALVDLRDTIRADMESGK